MKNVSLKKIITTVLSILLVLSVVFVISSCKQHQHTLVETVVVSAGCTETGTLQIKCSDAKCDYVKTESIPATGHNNVVTIITSPTCTEDGEVQTRCTKCGEKKNDVVKASGHNKVEVAAKGATCTTQGYPKHEKCKDCEWTTLKSTDIIAPLGHEVSNWKDDRQNSKPEYSIQYPNCTEGGYHYEYKECTRTKDSNGQYLNANHNSCGYNLEYVKVEDAPLGHDISTEQARAASCNIGWDTFDYCNGWTRAELSAKGYPYAPTIATSGPSINEASKGCGYNNYVEHPAIYNHVMTAELKYVEVKAATCEAEGVYALIRECTTCAVTTSIPSWKRPTWNKPSWYTPSVVVYTEFEVTPDGADKGVIEALGHEWQAHAAQDATCTVDGWKDFIMCSRCSRIDTDGDLTNNEVVPVIPASHIYQPDGCYNVCVRDVVREDGSVGKCGHISVENPYHHDVITSVSKEEGSSVAPTCVDAGFYTCIKYCNDCKREITREIVRIDPHGHDYVDHIAKKPTCTTVGWDAFKTCTRCDYTDFVQIDALDHKASDVATIHVVTEANCMYEGLEKHTYACLVCGETAKTEMVDIPKTGCDLRKVAEKPATCTEAGHNAYEYCIVCGASTIEVYGKLGHVIKTVEAQAPTCTEKGWYDYSVCTRENCNYNNKSDMMINATGHNIISYAAQEPTCTEVGWNTYLECEWCHDAKTSTYKENEIPATGHHPGKPVDEVIKPNTCTADGSYDVVEYCKSCNAELSRVNKVSPAIGHNYSESTGYCQNGCGDRISIGLAYSNNPDGTTCVVSGIGSCTDAEIIIPDEINGRKVVGIASSAFKQNTDITKVVIGNNVKTIGDYAFSRCTSLKTVVIGKSVASIDFNAFARCDSLNSVLYRGTAAQWNAISIGNVGNEDLTDANRQYNA